MRWALICQRNGARLGLSFGLSLHQHADMAPKAGDLTLLPGDNGRQILDGTRQIGHGLFQPFNPVLRLLVHPSSIR